MGNILNNPISTNDGINKYKHIRTNEYSKPINGSIRIGNRSIDIFSTKYNKKDMGENKMNKHLAYWIGGVSGAVLGFLITETILGGIVGMFLGTYMAMELKK